MVDTHANALVYQQSEYKDKYLGFFKVKVRRKFYLSNAILV